MWGQAVSTQLMLELTGARLVDGTVDVGGARSAAEDDPPARREGHAACSAPRSRSATRPSCSSGSSSASCDGGDGLDVTVPPVRRNDVTREVDLIEEVARLWGLEKLPGDAARPRRVRPPDRRAEAAPPRGRRAGRRRASPRRSAGASRRPRLARKLRPRRRPPSRLRNPLSEDLSVMRTTLLGSLLTAVRHNIARGAEDVRLFEEGSVYFDRPHGREPTAAEARSTPLPDERMHLAALMTGRLRPARGASASPPARRLLRRQGACWRRCWARCACDVDASCAATTRSCTRAARRGCWSRGEDAGWLGEVHPGVALRVGPRAGSRASSSTWASSCRTRTYVPAYEDLTSFPAIRQDLAFWVPADRTAAELVEVVRGAGGKLLRDVQRLRRLRARGPDVAGGAARVPRGRPHADRRGDRAAARQDRRGGAGEARGRAPCLRSPSSAPSATPARSPRNCSTATRSSSSRTSPRGRRPGQRLDDVHPRTRVPLELEVFDVDAARVDAAVVAYPHGAAAPVVAELRARGHAGRRPLGRLPAARPRDLRRLVRRAQGARALRAGRLRAAGAHARRTCAGADLVANPGCYPTAALLGLAPLARAGRDRRRGHRRQVGRLGRRPRARRTRRTSSRANENVSPYKITGPPAHARDRAGAAACSAPTCRSRSCRTCCRWTRASSSPAT